VGVIAGRCGSGVDGVDALGFVGFHITSNPFLQGIKFPLSHFGGQTFSSPSREPTAQYCLKLKVRCCSAFSVPFAAHVHRREIFPQVMQILLADVSTIYPPKLLFKQASFPNPET
jgi:hypothetical protein